MASSPAEQLARLPAAEREKVLAALTDDEADAILHDWLGFWARPSQIAPPVWSVLLWMTGRGFGKTRIGSEKVREWARTYSRIALVARTPADARDAMVEGESGILAVCPKFERPLYEPSKRRLTWPNGAFALIYSGEQPEALRGPQFEKAWMDELATYQYAEETFDNLELAVRLGDNPQTLITTTPRNVPIIKRLVKDPQVIIRAGSTYENIQNLAPKFARTVLARYEGTRRGAQEIGGQLLEDVLGAQWKREWIDNLRVRSPSEEMVRIVVAVDPPAGQTQVDAIEREELADCGIVVAGAGVCGCLGAPQLHGFILEDATVHGTPDVWADAALEAYKKWKADRIVAEANNGGEMVGFTISSRPEGRKVPITLVWASRGKITRAEPVAALYAPRTEIPMHHVGSWAELEDQMCTWVPGERSPDRMDALVWGLTQLFLSEGETDQEEGTVVYDEPRQISPV